MRYNHTGAGGAAVSKPLIYKLSNEIESIRVLQFPIEPTFCCNYVIKKMGKGGCGVEKIKNLFAVSKSKIGTNPEPETRNFKPETFLPLPTPTYYQPGK